MEVSLSFNENYDLAQESEQIDSLFDPEGKEKFTIYDPDHGEQTISHLGDFHLEDEEDYEVLKTDDEDAAFFLKEGYFPKHSKKTSKALRRKYNPEAEDRPKHSSQNNPKPKVGPADKRRNRLLSDRDDETFYNDQIIDALDPKADEEINTLLDLEEASEEELSDVLLDSYFAEEAEAQRLGEYFTIADLTDEDRKEAMRKIKQERKVEIFKRTGFRF